MDSRTAAVTLPPKTFTHVRRLEGKYSMTHPDKEQVQYIFQLRQDRDDILPEQFRKHHAIGFVIDLDEECFYLDSPPLLIADELLKIYTPYIYTRAKEELPALIPFLEATEAQDYRDRLQWSLEVATRCRDYWQERIDMLEQEITREVAA